MCMGGSKAPAPSPLAPPPIQGQDEAAMQSRDQERKRQAARAGSSSTILTGPSGAQAPVGQGKTLLGS